MSQRLPTFDSAIRFLEAQLADLDQRRAKLAAALEGLRFVADGPPALPDTWPREFSRKAGR